MEQAKTIADIERIIFASGQWDGTGPVEFSADGGEWTDAWPDDEPPMFARVEVHRKGVKVPTRATIKWSESVPADAEWAQRWHRAPMAFFGARVKRSGYRQTFRDLVEVLANPEEGDEPEPSAPAEDYAAAIAAAESVDDLLDLGKRMKKLRAFTTVLDRQWRARKRELEAEAVDAPKQQVHIQMISPGPRPVTPLVMARQQW